MKNKEKLIERAIIFAQEKHNGQLRKDGSPYITHPLRVSGIVNNFKKSHKIKELIAAAILHDTLEDTDTGISELRENFGELITLLVVELTSDKFKSNCLGKSNYLSEKMGSSKKISNWTLMIKLADRLDNISDLNMLQDKSFVERYKKETEEIIINLEKNRQLSETHKSIISEIKKKLKDFN